MFFLDLKVFSKDSGDWKGEKKWKHQKLGIVWCRTSNSKSCTGRNTFWGKRNHWNKKPVKDGEGVISTDANARSLWTQANELQRIVILFDKFVLASCEIMLPCQPKSGKGNHKKTGRPTQCNKNIDQGIKNRNTHQQKHAKWHSTWKPWPSDNSKSIGQSNHSTISTIWIVNSKPISSSNFLNQSTYQQPIKKVLHSFIIFIQIKSIKGNSSTTSINQIHQTS